MVSLPHTHKRKKQIGFPWKFSYSYSDLLVVLLYIHVTFCVANALWCLIVTAKLVPVGYGIKKLQIMLTIVDDLVSVDSLIEEHLTVEPCNEYVQSCDIVAFNKI